MENLTITFLMVTPRLTTDSSRTPTAPPILAFCFIDAKVPTLHPVISLALRCSLWEVHKIIVDCHFVMLCD